MHAGRSRFQKLGLLSLFGLLGLNAAAQTNYTVLRLLGLAPDGIQIAGRPTLGSDGLLDGVTFQGGSESEGDGAGTIFRLARDGRGYLVLRRFTISGDQPRYPNGALTEAADGRLYGVLSQGGTANRGAVFGINKDGTGYATLRSFLMGTDGAGPTGQLCQGTDGALYGVTQSGGSSQPQSTGGPIFKINRHGTGYVVLRRFLVNATDGHLPLAGVIEGSDGMLHGTTRQGGSSRTQFSPGSGTIYRISKSGTGHSILRSFTDDGATGRFPQTELLQASDAFLYGMTEQGGSANRGVVFKIGTAGTDFAVIHHFSSTGGDGRTGIGPLIEGPEGALYGTTRGGGAKDAGTVFRVNKDGAGYTILKSFSNLPGDGTGPAGGLVQNAGGWLYGTTAFATGVGGGAAFLGGAVFLLSPIPMAILEPPLAGAAPLGAVAMLGAAFVSYRLQCTTDLRSPAWTDVATNTTAVGGRVIFTNLPTVDPSRFYRVVTP
jgi:uncharacterized repeat protein (TIGR03803 family)